MENFESTKWIEIMGHQFAVDSDGFVEIGDVSRSLLKMQSQYGARYADGLDTDYPNFGEGLRIKGGAASYHTMKIHADDVEEFVAKVLAYKNQR